MPPAFADHAVGVDDADADQQVAQRAVAVPARAAGVGGDQAADGRAVGQRRVERQHLVVLAEHARSGRPSVMPASTEQVRSSGS